MTTERVLQDLIRIDSQNPPGNERAVVDFISALCRSHDLAHQVVTTGEGRANIVIRLAPELPDRIVLLGHLDVVQADPKRWDHDPFGAEIVDGFLYGRGALDMKYFVAVAMQTLIALKPREANLNRGITAVFTADEEAGSSFGLPKLLEDPALRDELRGRAVLNEGGGFAYRSGGRWYSLIETGQKTVCRLRVTVAERPGTNPYFPTMTHEAILADATEAVQSAELPHRMPNTAQTLVSRILGGGHDLSTPAGADAVVAHLTERGDRFLSGLVHAMTHSMITPTVVRGGARHPDLQDGIKATVDFDCRLLPGITRDEFLDAVDRALADLEVEREILSFSEGYDGPGSSTVFAAAEAAIRRHDGEIAAAVPFLTPGANDGKYLRPLGCEVIGFAPLDRSQPFEDVIGRIHGDNERISLSGLEFCRRVIGDVCERYVEGRDNE